MKQDNIFGNGNTTSMTSAEAVEGPHWAPPEAPLAMPRQVLERDGAEAQGAGQSLLARLLQPSQWA